MKKIFLLAIITVFISCTAKKYKEPHVLISTTAGDIEVELYPDKAPKSVAGFLANVDKGIYKGAAFYRVLKNEDLGADNNEGLIQGGVYKTDLSKAAQPFIEHESPKQTGLSNTSGAISLARTTPGSASTEFFICIGDQTQFDSSRRTNPDGLGYAVFGKVFTGMPVVRSIQSGKNNGDQMVNQIKILDIKRL